MSGVGLLRIRSFGALEGLFGQIMGIRGESDAKRAIELDDVELESILIVESNRHDDAPGLDDVVLEYENLAEIEVKVNYDQKPIRREKGVGC
jgi:hypothetical protein